VFRTPRLILVSSLLVLLFVFSAQSAAPPVQMTGAPQIATVAAESTCAKVGCHAGNPLNSQGKLEILGLPDRYVPGTDYPLTVRLSASQTAAVPRWGFQITNARLSDGIGSGTLAGASLNLNLVNQRTYISQNVSHLYMGELGPVEWQITWTAPNPAEGPVAFYATGCVANGSFTAAGDFVYTAGETTGSDIVPVDHITWGRLKSAPFIGRGKP